MHASASSGGGKRISQNEFTEKAWQAVVAAPDIAKQYQQQIVVRPETTCRACTCDLMLLCRHLAAVSEGKALHTTVTQLM